MNDFLTTKEVAKFLKVSVNTIVNYRKKGLPYKKLGYNTFRYDVEEVKAWIDSKA